MTVPANIRIAGPYDCTGGETVFDYDFLIRDISDITVKRSRGGAETTLVAGTNYTVTGIGVPSGGTVVLDVAAEADDSYVIIGLRATVRSSDLSVHTAFNPTHLNREFDHLQTQLVEARRDIDGAFKISDFGDAYDVGGNRITNLGTPTGATDAATKSYVDAETTARGVADAVLQGQIDALVDVTSGTIQPPLVYQTRSSFSASNIGVSVNQVLTLAYAVAGDGGGATFVRLASTPSPVKAWHVQSADGAWWTMDDDDVHVEAFGGMVGFTTAELQALAGAAAVFTRAAAFDAAIAAANEYMKARGGGTIYVRQSNIYVHIAPIRHGSNVGIDGSGVGDWEPTYPQRPKTWTGTALLSSGTGTKNVTFPGITSQEHGGGWRPDPDNPGEYFKQFTGYNANASGTTPATLRAYSVAVMAEEGATYGGPRNLRICNWVGADGISDWSNQAMTSLGDDWDFGYIVKDNEYCEARNIQTVGGYRQAGRGEFTTAISASKSERNVLEIGKSNGLIVRGPDRWWVTNKTWSGSVGTVTIRWSSELYWPATGTFRGSNGTTYTYTGVTHAGSDPNFVFTGVTPDPTPIFDVRHPSAGFANSEYDRFYCYALDHVSGLSPAALGGGPRFALEASGYPLRAVKFRNSKLHTRASDGGGCYKIHDAQDIEFDRCQVEGSGHCIASPERTDGAWAAAQVGETRNLQFTGVGHAEQDLRLFTPRSGLVMDLQIAPRSNLNGDLPLRPLRIGRAVDLQDATGVSFLRSEEKTWSPAWRFVTATMTVQTGVYWQVGKLVTFRLRMEWTGLDTADTSNLDILLPVAPSADAQLDAQINERLSTGVNMSSLTRPYVDISAGLGLGLSHSRTVRVAYNTAGVMSAAGVLVVSGSYVAA